MIRSSAVIRRTMLVLSSVILLCLSGCSPSVPQGFSINLTKNKIPPDQMEALSYVEPDDPPLISQNDITAYDAQTHAIELTASAFSRVNQMVNPVNGTSFLVCVDASPVYWGALWSPYSSLSFSGVVIQIPPVAEKPNTIRLELGYPSPSVYQGQDPRDNGTVLEALDKDGKLINKP